MRRFDVVLVAVTVLVVLALEGAALVAGWFGGWTRSVPAAFAVAALLIYLGLRQRTILILLTGLIMCTQSFLYWYGDYAQPLPYLLGTLAGSLVVIGGTLHDLFRSRHQVSGRLLALPAVIVSAALSFLAWNAVKVITEHLRPELLVLIAASIIATVALAADLAHPARSRRGRPTPPPDAHPAETLDRGRLGRGRIRRGDRLVGEQERPCQSRSTARLREHRHLIRWGPDRCLGGRLPRHPRGRHPGSHESGSASPRLRNAATPRNPVRRGRLSSLPRRKDGGDCLGGPGTRRTGKLRVPGGRVLR